MSTERKSTILNVAGDSALRAAIGHVQRSGGFEVVEAADGAEALRLARQQPDLILLDAKLPDMDGFEVCRQLKADPATSAIPIVCLSAAHPEGAAPIRDPQDGVDGFLTLPVEPGALISVVQALLRARQAEERLRCQAGDDAERKRAQEALQVSERRQRTILQTAMDGFWRANLQAHLLEVNDAYCRMSGYSEEELLGMSISALEVVETPADTAARVQRILARGEDRFESRHRRKDGSIFDVEVSVQYKPADGGGTVAFLRDITERKRAEKTLYESEQRFRATFEQAVVGMAHVSLDGRWLRVNQRMCDLLGYSAEELLQRTFASLTHPDDVQADLVARQKLAAGEIQAYRREKRYIRKDGRLVWASLYVALVRDPAGEPAYFASVCEDMTERKRAEEALYESEAKNGAILNAIPDMLFVQNRDGTFLDYRASAPDRLYAQPGEFLGKKMQDVFPGEFAATFPDSIERAIVTGTMQVREYALSVLGRLQQFEARIVPYGEDKVLSIIRDIGERKRAEEALQASEERFRSLYENTAVGIYRTTPDGRIIMANPALVNMLGYETFEELAQRDLTQDGFEPEYPREVFQRRLRRDGIISGLESAWKRKDGSTIFVRENARVVSDENGQPLYYDGSAEDITERKRSEEERERLQAELFQAQKMESVGRLAGGVAHDFNNLLTAIIGYANFVKEALPEESPIIADIEQVLRGAERAAGLTRQLLAFSRRQRIEPEIVDLNELVLDVDKMLRRLVGEDIEMVVSSGHNLGRVKVDRGQMQQVLMNLAVNARDAMPGGGRLSIETANVTLDEHYAKMHPDASAGAYVMLRVSDTGCGMSEAVKAHVFEPFFTTKEVGKGTGLGLATVYGIIEQHGGTIACDSEPGRGTCFEMYLPRVDAEPAPFVDEPAQALPRGVETILLVEDEATVRRITARTLLGLGYAVLQASNGDDALRVVGEYPGRIDLLLSDVVMPQMGGPRLAEALRLGQPQLKVILMSGYTGDVPMPGDKSKEGIHFMQKPFTMAALARKVREALDTPAG